MSETINWPSYVDTDSSNVPHGRPRAGRHLGRAVGTDPTWARTLPRPLEAAGLVDCTWLTVRAVGYRR